MEIKLLTKKQNQVMTILWNADHPLSASQIKAEDPDLNMNTVQQVLHALLKMEYIKVADIGYSNTVLARLYAPVLTQKKYIQYLLGAHNSFECLCLMLDEKMSLADLEKLEAIIQEKKEKMLNK